MFAGHDPYLVALSVVIAILGGYTGFGLAARIRGTPGVSPRVLLAGAAGFLAVGIWTMHFIGMLAAPIPPDAVYLVLPTIISFLICALVVGISLFFVSIGEPSLPRVIASAVLLGVGIAFRPTVRPALAASIAWSLGVWWFGEGLGGVLNGGASPLNGAPGGVILYALLAVLLWPADRAGRAPFVAARAVGAPVARALWLVLWLSLAYFAVTPANRAPGAVSGMISAMTDGEPHWLSSLLNAAASLVTGADLATSIALAVVLVVIAGGTCLPAPVAKGTLVLAVMASLVIWVFAEALGGILAGGATDPNSGPLLIVLALAYWPARGPGQPGEQEVAS